MFKPSVDPQSLDPSSGPLPSSPAAGVLVDCKRFSPGGRPRVQAIPKPKEPPLRSLPVGPPPRKSRARRRKSKQHWRTPAALFGIGMAIVVLLTLGSLYLCQSPAHADDAAHHTSFTPREVRPDNLPADNFASTLPMEPIPLYVKPLPPSLPTVSFIKPAPQPSAPAANMAVNHPPDNALATPPSIAANFTDPDGGVKAFAIARPVEPSIATPASDFCGTAVSFVATPLMAGQQAAKEHKLLFVLHVSGNFEDPGFT